MTNSTQFNCNLSGDECFVEAFNKGPALCKTMLNADLYDQIFKFVFEKRIVLEVFWMPSHLLDYPDKERKKPTPEWVTRKHVLGNHHADRLAGIVASYYALHNDIADPIINNVLLVRAVQKRLYTIICNLPNRKIDREAKKQRVKAPTFQELRACTNHALVESNDDSLRCEVCLGVSYGTGPSARKFLKGYCKPCGYNSRTHKVHGQISMNGCASHISHNLRYQMNKYICISCGFYSEYKLVKLKLPCPRAAEARTEHGNRMLKRFSENQEAGSRSARRLVPRLSPSEASARHTPTPTTISICEMQVDSEDNIAERDAEEDIHSEMSVDGDDALMLINNVGDDVSVASGSSESE